MEGRNSLGHSASGRLSAGGMRRHRRSESWMNVPLTRSIAIKSIHECTLQLSEEIGGGMVTPLNVAALTEEQQ